ncbi:hypothetical protein GGR56DRAFT_640215 [Xylariaceae sp. FL0804]|nr:hypothetical protein GGR56DRAFT_640215 [Xylariaceae sp. FL0804]
MGLVPFPKDAARRIPGSLRGPRGKTPFDESLLTKPLPGLQAPALRNTNPAAAPRISNLKPGYGKLAPSVRSQMSPHGYGFELLQHMSSSSKFQVKDSPGCRLSVKHSRSHCFHPDSQKYLTQDGISGEHANCQTILDYYVASTRKPLWMHVKCTYGRDTRPYARTTGEGRVKHALRDALRLAGFDQYGRKREKSSVIADLHGTLYVQFWYAKVIHTKYESLVEAAQGVIDLAVQELRRDHQGNFLVDESRPIIQNQQQQDSEKRGPTDHRRRKREKGRGKEPQEASRAEIFKSEKSERPGIKKLLSRSRRKAPEARGVEHCMLGAL